MNATITTGQPAYFEASIRDFTEQAGSLGWPFWRGVAVGFLAAFPLAHLALAGDGLLAWIV